MNQQLSVLEISGAAVSQQNINRLVFCVRASTATVPDIVLDNILQKNYISVRHVWIKLHLLLLVHGLTMGYSLQLLV